MTCVWVSAVRLEYRAASQAPRTNALGVAAGPLRDADGGAWLDVAAALVRLGRLQTPWLASGALSLEGVRHALGGPGRWCATRVTDRADGCEFALPGQGLSVRCTVTAAARTSLARSVPTLPAAATT